MLCSITLLRKLQKLQVTSLHVTSPPIQYQKLRDDVGEYFHIQRHWLPA